MKAIAIINNINNPIKPDLLSQIIHSTLPKGRALLLYLILSGP